MDSEGFTAAAHTVAFDHLSVLKILPISTLFTENLNPKQRIICDREEKDNIDEHVGEADSIRNDRNCSDIDVTMSVTHLRSALHIACQWGSVECLQHILQCNNTETESATQEIKGSQKEHLSGSVTVGHCVDLPGTPGITVIPGKPDPEIRINEEQHNSEAKKKRSIFNVNAALSDGTTPLHLAARYGHLSCIKLLVAAEADFRVLDFYGNSSLCLAQKWGREDCAEYLSGLCDKSAE